MRPSEPGRESWPGFGWAPIHFTVLRQRRDPFGIFGHPGCSPSGLDVPLQPRRLMIAPAAVGCKRVCP